MTDPLSKYALINAKLRARISKILPEELFHQLAHTTSLDATLALLRETPFAGLEEIYSRTGDLKQVELQLLRNEIMLYRNVKKHLHSQSTPLINALLYQFEIDNLKNALRIYFDQTIRGRTVDATPLYVLYDPIVHNLPIDLICNAQNFDEVSGLCEGTPYRDIIRKYSYEVESRGSLF
ncbi:MAG: V-type ATPase subunit, partial [Kiritimatiellaceae bacterium]|nr:V-type ATPase subunit [Kiritimatiellaceae bacterium]